MLVNANADIEITAFKWVPPFAAGLVRDLRVRWALEEAGLDYRERLLDAMTPRPREYLAEQPFDQVPVYRDGEVAMFESGAIVLHIAGKSAALMPRDPEGRARATSWVLAALNSVEPFVQQASAIGIFNADKEWAPGAQAYFTEFSRKRFARLADWLGDKDWLEDQFTAGDLMMTSVLRILRDTGIVAEFPNLAAYQARCEARPAFQRALDAQLAAFTEPSPGAIVEPANAVPAK